MLWIDMIREEGLQRTALILTLQEATRAGRSSGGYLAPSLGGTENVSRTKISE